MSREMCAVKLVAKLQKEDEKHLYQLIHKSHLNKPRVKKAGLMSIRDSNFEVFKDLNNEYVIGRTKR